MDRVSVIVRGTVRFDVAWMLPSRHLTSSKKYDFSPSILDVLLHSPHPPHIYNRSIPLSLHDGGTARAELATLAHS